MKTPIQVVIVEDDPMVLELHRQFINKIKEIQLIGVAQDGKEGIKAISILKPQLVILDVYMPEVDGIEVLKEIRKLGLNIDVIFITAAHNSEMIQLAMQYGAVDYIIKPFTFQRFKKAMLDYCKYINKIKESNNLTQKEIDYLRERTVNVPVERNLPKGLDNRTLDQVVMTIKTRQGQFTVSDIAAIMGISCVTARRYLNFLHENGWLASVLSYGPVGRPLQKYSVDGDIILSG
jgi:response regulator of citrate/malate metabolism